MTRSMAVYSLILAQVTSAVNVYALSSIFSFIATDIGQDVSGLGFVTATFVLGLGLFQLPAGILSVKIGPRKTNLYGNLMISAASLSTPFFSNLYYIAILDRKSV